MYCEECENHISNKEDFKCYFLQNDRATRKLHFNRNVNLCLDCFNKMFSVTEFAKRAYKNLPEHICCTCESDLKWKKQTIYIVRCCNYGHFIEIYYCNDCYVKDFGEYGKQNEE